MSENFLLLQQSLLELKPCTAVYDGLPRLLCPHVLGHKGIEEQVLCWQYGGQSSTPLPPQGQWKCLTVAKISQLTLNGDAWCYGEKGKTGVPTFCVGTVTNKIDL